MKYNESAESDEEQKEEVEEKKADNPLTASACLSERAAFTFAQRKQSKMLERKLESCCRRFKSSQIKLQRPL